MSVLDSIEKSSDIKKLNIKELKMLSDELRELIIQTASSNGGHLSSNLGIVETTLALHYVFDFPEDKLIFDVGHQCYAHKILSGRKDVFKSIRTDGGISGFPDTEESEYDAFTTGHAGTSVAAGLGYCAAREIEKQDYCVINLVGDGAMFNGLNLEALASSFNKPNNYLVILNDNGMSISKNGNGLYRRISKTTMGRGYVKGKSALKKIFGSSFITRGLSGFKNFLKRMLNKNSYFEIFGFKYVGVIDGNDISEMVNVLKRVRTMIKTKAVFLHIRTTKGKGYERAEERADMYHGVGKNLTIGSNVYSTRAGESLSRMIDGDKKIVAITAAMKDGTGLTAVEKAHPDNFYDVGIAEEYAVTLAAGMAAGGVKPVVAVYSTFLQRAYDEILHDVCLQNLPVVFLVDRAGFVGADGKTHQGVFDISFLSHMPNMRILAPASPDELELALKYALSLGCPVAVRYPNDAYAYDTGKVDFDKSLWYRVREGRDMTVLAVGPRMMELAEKISDMLPYEVGVVNARSVKPLDENMLDEISSGPVITLEENSEIGGFGGVVRRYYADKGSGIKVFSYGVKDSFVRHGSVCRQMRDNGLTCENICEDILKKQKKG